MTTERPPTIDPQAATRWQQIPLHQSPWLHEEVARRMQERLDWIKLRPKTWVNWEPLRGGLQAQALLMHRYPDSACAWVQTVDGQLETTFKTSAKPWWHPARWRGEPRQVGLPNPGVQMVWANMALHMAADPQALIRNWKDALSADGFLMFSCLGPDTLCELRGLYQTLGWPAPAHEFTDMHDWGDMLVQAGFAEPIMDMERIELTFETPQRLLQELRELGRNLHPGRLPGLRGRVWLEQLHHAMAQKLTDPAQGGRLKLTFEVVYGHAFKPHPRIDMSAQTVVSLDAMRQALHAPKGQPRKP
jgi:malonyl-CoA O-methyltransferase